MSFPQRRPSSQPRCAIRKRKLLHLLEPLKLVELVSTSRESFLLGRDETSTSRLGGLRSAELQPYGHPRRARHHSIRAQPNNSAPQSVRLRHPSTTRLRRRSAGDANGWQGCVHAMDWRYESCPPAFGAFPRAAIWRLSILPSRFWLLRSSVGLVWLRSLPPAFLQTATIPRCAPSWFVDSAQQALRCLCFLCPCKFKL